MPNAAPPFEEVLTLTEACTVGWQLAQNLKYQQHNPVELTAQLDSVADRVVVLHPAGNSRAISLGIFAAQATPAAVVTAVNALV